MKKTYLVGLLFWAIVWVFPCSISAQLSLDFTQSAPEVVYNGTEYFLNVPEFGFMSSHYGVQWQLNLTDGFWAPIDVWQVWNRAFVVTTDFSTGSFSTIDISALTANNNIGVIHNDAVAQSVNGNIYVINRFGQNNIIVYENANFSVPRQFSVAVNGENTDPHALVLVSPTKAYVTLFNMNFILIINPQTGAELGRIDLTAFADADNKVEADQALLVNGHVYVLLQALDRRGTWWPPAGGGILLKINPVTDAVENSMTLRLQNPGSMFYHPGRRQMLVGAVGTYTNIGDGGIEAVNLSTMTSEGVLVSETALGGNLGSFVMADSSKGYALISDASFNYQVVSFNLNTGEKMTSIFGPTSAFLQNISVHKERLYLCDRTMTAPGIRIFDVRNDSQITTAPINVGLPPFMIVFY